MNTAQIIGLGLIGLFVVGYGWHRLATWMERRGWIYYRSQGKGGGAGAMAAMEVFSMLQPDLEHTVEEIRSEAVRGEQRESGEDLDPSEA